MQDDPNNALRGDPAPLVIEVVTRSVFGNDEEAPAGRPHHFR